MLLHVEVILYIFILSSLLLRKLLYILVDFIFVFGNLDLFLLVYIPDVGFQNKNFTTDFLFGHLYE